MAAKNDKKTTFSRVFKLKKVAGGKCKVAGALSHRDDSSLLEWSEDMKESCRRKNSRFEDQKVYVIAALFISPPSFIYSKKSDYDLVKQNCVVSKIWNTKSTRRKCLK